MKCEICKDEGWVCENHPNVAWNYGYPECCGGAGMMCTCHSQYGKGREADFSEDFSMVIASTKTVDKVHH